MLGNPGKTRGYAQQENYQRDVLEMWPSGGAEEHDTTAKKSWEGISRYEALEAEKAANSRAKLKALETQDEYVDMDLEDRNCEAYPHHIATRHAKVFCPYLVIVVEGQRSERVVSTCLLQCLLQPECQALSLFAVSNGNRHGKQKLILVQQTSTNKNGGARRGVAQVKEPSRGPAQLRLSVSLLQPTHTQTHTHNFPHPSWIATISRL